jgi:hypothetical protein
MGLEKLVLKNGQIALTELPRDAQDITLDNSPFLFGTIEAVNDLSDNYTVGSVVIFDATNALKFVFEGDYYFLITEDNIKLKQLA